MEFGENLKKAREAKGITQQTLAERLYVTRQAVSKWECGSRYPDLLTAKCIADILGVSIDSLVSNDEMKQFSEKQSIAKDTKWEKIITAIFAIVCTSSVSLAASRLFSTIYSLNNDRQEVFSLLALIFVIIPIILYALIGVISMFGLVKSIKQDVTPKIAGIIGMSFYGILGIQELIATLNYKTSYKNIGVFALSLVFVAIIGLYFINRKQKLAKVLIIGYIISIIYFIALPIFSSLMIYKGGNFEASFSYIYTIGGITNIFIVVLLLIQTILLERKRKTCNTFK